MSEGLESGSRPAPLLLLLHVLAAAFQRTGAAFGDDDLRSALRAEIHLPELIRHDSLPFLSLGGLLVSLAVEYRLPPFQERMYALVPIACCL